MNKFEIRKITNNYNIDDHEIYIDGEMFSSILTKQKIVQLPENVEPFEDLCLAWTKDLDNWGDIRFVWNLLNRKKSILPVLMCPEDLDFSCIVIVVEVEKTEDAVIWKRAGYVCKTEYDYNVEKQSGILAVEFYSDRDWYKYGDNIAQQKVDSDEWKQWIADNWDEELYRRRMNYTLQNFEKEDNIIWFANINLQFDLFEYEKKISEYWEQQTLFYLECYPKKEMTFSDCVKMIKSLSRNGEEKYEEHLQKHGEILLHIFASDEISNPLFKLLLKDDNKILVDVYCKAIELMWKYGTEEVVNVVDVTLLERLSNDSIVWNRLGEYFSDEFKKYINEDLLRSNIAMCGVLPIK